MREIGSGNLGMKTFDCIAVYLGREAEGGGCGNWDGRDGRGRDLVSSNG